MSSPRRNGVVETGVATFTLPGETVAGDRYVVRATTEGVMIAVIDGLGHGIEAARAAEAAVEVVNTYAPIDVSDLVTECHRRLRQTRGVVMSVVSLSQATGTLSCAGVGNVQGMVARTAGGDKEPKRDFWLLRGGVVGHILPPVRLSLIQIDPGDTVVMATDGVSIEFTTALRLNEPPQQLAERLLADYASRNDDALVLVARYLSE